MECQNNNSKCSKCLDWKSRKIAKHTKNFPQAFHWNHWSWFVKKISICVFFFVMAVRTPPPFFLISEEIRIIKDVFQYYTKTSIIWIPQIWYYICVIPWHKKYLLSNTVRLAKPTVLTHKIHLDIQDIMFM